MYRGCYCKKNRVGSERKFDKSPHKISNKFPTFIHCQQVFVDVKDALTFCYLKIWINTLQNSPDKVT